MSVAHSKFILTFAQSYGNINVKGYELLSKEWCEIVFEGRQRDYGAYMLRSNAGKRYSMALRIVVCLALCLFALPFLLKCFVDFRKIDDAPILGETTILKIRKWDFRDNYQSKEVELLPEENPAKGAVMSVPEIVDVVKPPKPLGELDDETAIEKMLAELHSEQVEQVELVSSAKDLFETGSAMQNFTPQGIVESMPEFPGGMASLMRWLDKNVNYPDNLVKQGVEGDMEVSFFVDKKGMVDGAFISQSLHPQLDSIVLKVINKMPRWKPARIDNRLELVQVSIPIHFEKQ